MTKQFCTFSVDFLKIGEKLSIYIITCHLTQLFEVIEIRMCLVFSLKILIKKHIFYIYIYMYVYICMYI